MIFQEKILRKNSGKNFEKKLGKNFLPKLFPKFFFKLFSAGQRSGNFSDSNSPCLKKLGSVKFPQFHDMLNESERYRVTASYDFENVF